MEMVNWIQRLTLTFRSYDNPFFDTLFSILYPDGISSGIIPLSNTTILLYNPEKSIGCSEQNSFRPHFEYAKLLALQRLE